MRYYNSLNISSEEEFSTHTRRILSYYDMLGRMLGYRISSELTMNSLIDDAPKYVGNKKMDLTWWRHIDEDYYYELGVESQQSPSLNAIKSDIRKLSYLPANNLLLYCSWDRPKEIIKLVSNDFKKYGKKNNSKFLIIVDPWTDKTPMCEGKFSATLLNINGDILGRGSAKVSEVEDIDTCMRIISKAQWNYL